MTFVTTINSVSSIASGFCRYSFQATCCLMAFRRKIEAAVNVSGDCMTQNRVHLPYILRMEEISMLLSMNQDHGARKKRNVHLDSKFVA